MVFLFHGVLVVTFQQVLGLAFYFTPRGRSVLLRLDCLGFENTTCIDIFCPAIAMHRLSSSATLARLFRSTTGNELGQAGGSCRTPRLQNLALCRG